MSEPPRGNDPSSPSMPGADTPPPGRERYEELYRPDGIQARRGEQPALPPRPRHFQSALTPPESQNPDDTYGWLYRTEPAHSSPGRGGELPSDHPDRVPMWGEGPQPDGHGEEPGQTQQSWYGSHAPGEAAVAPQVEVLDQNPAELTERVRHRWPMILIGLATLLVAILVVGFVVLFNSMSARPAATATGQEAPPSTSGAATSQQATRQSATKAPAQQRPWDGPVVAVTPTEVAADCTAKPAKDGAGNRVSYNAGLVADGDPSTAWRCDGAAVGEKLTFDLPQATKVAEVGLINGYAKTDPKTGEERYGEYRRITSVTWTFSDGSSIEQSLADGNQDIQTLRIPVKHTGTVELMIDQSTAAGSKNHTRDAVLISEVRFSSPQQ